MSLTMVEAAIADGRARQGIRDLAGCVVEMLCQRRDHGWTPPPPAPRADAPEVLAAYFRERAAEQRDRREGEQGEERTVAEHPTEVRPLAASPASPAKLEQPPSLADVWRGTLAGLRLRLPRDVYGTCVRHSTLISYADGVATIGASGNRTKDALEFGYLGGLRFALGDALGREVAVHVVIRPSLPDRSHDKST